MSGSKPQRQRERARLNQRLLFCCPNGYLLPRRGLKPAAPIGMGPDQARRGRQIWNRADQARRGRQERGKSYEAYATASARNARLAPRRRFRRRRCRPRHTPHLRHRHAVLETDGVQRPLWTQRVEESACENRGTPSRPPGTLVCRRDYEGRCAADGMEIGDGDAEADFARRGGRESRRESGRC